jgi:hypothetical protein
MKNALTVLAAASALAASGCFAAGTCRPATTSATSTMNVAAPEMRWVESAVDTCLSAQELVDRARAEAARAVPATAGNVDANGYKPKTKDDNSPWRFDMNQNGKRMTADEFAAWMKAKGITVATGKPGGAAAATAPAAATPPPEEVPTRRRAAGRGSSPPAARCDRRRAPQAFANR